MSTSEEAMIRWLLDQGHDLVLARDDFPRSSDMDLLTLALETRRVVLTRNKDYGDLIFRDRRHTSGVILIRLRARDQFQRLELFKPFWPQIEAAAPGSMIVVANNHIRIKPILSS